MEDDEEEMKSLRESKGDSSKDEANKPSATQSHVQGTQKKARTFDFMAMFQEARKTAIDRTKDNIDSEPPDIETLTVSKKEKSRKESSSSSGSDSDSSADSDSDSSSSDEKPNSKTKKDKPKKKAVSSDSDEEVVGPPLPPGMLGPDKTKRSDEEEDDIGPPLPPGMRGGGDSDEDDSEEEEESLISKIPSSHEILLNHGVKPVSALALDPSGARLVTGGVDYEMKFWDFAGMDTSLKSFRSIRPCECHPIKQLQYSSTGDTILVVSGNNKAKVLDRDGFEKMECAKGDPYLLDMSNTKGHSAMLNSGCWHPKTREEFMTCSNDGTVRLWDVNMEGKKHKTVLKPRTQLGRKTVPTTCTYSKDGRWVATACQDGSIQIWDHNKSFVNVSMVNRNCHMNGSDTSCLCFSYCGQILASRGGDDTLKTWDIRNFKKPLNVVNDLDNFFSFTDCVFSPDDQMIITGLSVKKNTGKGKLLFYERNTLTKLSELEISDSSVVRCLWHPKLNQMVVGCADGQVRLFYDPKKSQRGAMLSVVKSERKSRQIKVMTTQQIITPYALPMFREGRPTSTRKAEERVRKDPVKSRRPDLPITGPGEGGRVAQRGATLSQYVVQNLVLRKPDKYENDPREAILRHAKEAEENPFWVEPAYKKNQPVRIFQEVEEEKKDDDDDEPLWKKAKLG
ncbi:WD repeat-containing protein 70-like isoform X2 [Mizuhopecten yessoensis]|uniref:WD repeat-containing protein 70-like isoform X2 n=1 Tax=Mizuhopecten yessoensis TaxID=6573 RepID=UPI000B45BA70|nr:WD repeat-containing protein 70-like isoform X2 [Mizuhopecten yessoensis]